MVSYWFDQDTFRGRVCECPVVNGVQYKGDGYTTCEGKPVMSCCSTNESSLYNWMTPMEYCVRS